MSGLLRGWLGGESLATAATWANACGAFAVSRLLCAPEYPTFEELQYFLKNGSTHQALRKDEAINHIHWATTRRREIPSMMALGHRPSRPARRCRAKAPAPMLARSAPFKVLAVKAAAKVAAGRGGYGMLLDEKYRPRGDVRIRPSSFRLARPAGGIAGIAAAALRVLAGYRLATGRNGRSTIASSACASIIPDDPAALKTEQQAEAAHAVRGGAQGRARTADRDHRRQARQARRRHDPAGAGRTLCAGHQAGLVEAGAAGLGRRLEEDRGSDREATIPGAAASCCSGWKRRRTSWRQAFAATANAPVVKGFAVGRTMFMDAAERWLVGQHLAMRRRSPTWPSVSRN